MSQEILGQGKYLRLVRTGGWEHAERANATGIVVIVPKTAAGEFVLVEQYRPPVQADCIEFPAGLAGDEVDAADESLLAAARRELREETGYDTDELRFLGHSPPTAGLTSEVMSFYLATGVKKFASGGGVGSERIIVHVVPEKDVRGWLRRQVPRAQVALMVYAGLYLGEDGQRDSAD